MKKYLIYTLLKDKKFDNFILYVYFYSKMNRIKSLYNKLYTNNLQ